MNSSAPQNNQPPAANNTNPPPPSPPPTADSPKKDAFILNDTPAEPPLDIPIQPRVIANTKDTTIVSPTESIKPKITGNKPNKKTALILVLLFVTVSAIGFGGSVLYYSTYAHTNTPPPAAKKISELVATPTVYISPTPAETVNPFVTPTISFRNFFSSVAQAYENPFSDNNPFTEANSNESNSNQPYQNPFEGLK